MHHVISYHLAQARIAGLRHRAQRDALARAARSNGRRPGLHPWVLRRTPALPCTAQAARGGVACDAPAR